MNRKDIETLNEAFRVIAESTKTCWVNIETGDSGDCAGDRSASVFAQQTLYGSEPDEDGVRKAVSKTAPHMIALSGPPDMVDAAIAGLKDKGEPVYGQ
jgi:hypothetical protein